MIQQTKNIFFYCLFALFLTIFQRLILINSNMELEAILRDANPGKLPGYSVNQRKKVEWVKQLYSNIQKKLRAYNNTDRHLTETADGLISPEGCKEFLIVVQPKYSMNTIKNCIIPSLKLLFKEQQANASTPKQRRHVVAAALRAQVLADCFSDILKAGEPWPVGQLH